MMLSQSCRYRLEEGCSQSARIMLYPRQGVRDTPGLPPNLRNLNLRALDIQNYAEVKTLNKLSYLLAGIASAHISCFLASRLRPFYASF